MKMRIRYALVVLIAIGALGAVSFRLFRPRPTRLEVTTRAGDDTVVVNQVRRTRLSAFVLDQYGRRMRSDSAIRYRRISGDSVRLSASGDVECVNHSDATVRATVAKLVRQFVLRCRPVAWIEAASWLDLVAGDSMRDLSFVAHAPNGRVVTELRGAITVRDSSVVEAHGTTVRPKEPGQTVAIIDVGNAEAHIPIMVYQPVTSFVASTRKLTLMAMRVSLPRGDTTWAPLPKAAFWVTYLSKDHGGIPPTIELDGPGMCTTGNGLQARRIEDGEYAKYCLAGAGARLMIAHGVAGAERVNGVVAIRMMW